MRSLHWFKKTERELSSSQVRSLHWFKKTERELSSSQVRSLQTLKQSEFSLNDIFTDLHSPTRLERES